MPSNRKPIHQLCQFVAPILAMALFLSSCATNRPYANKPRPADLHLPDVLNDPAEPLNRGIWAFNHGLLQGVVHPVGRGYRMVVPSPARTSIKNFGYNLGYPGRALNQVLQGRVGDAGDESVRFVTNTTAGVLGLFDVASDWNIPKHKGNFAQTFQTWGWNGKHFIVLPVFGPSDESSAAGLGADRLSDPLTYYSDGRKVVYGVTFNNITESAPDILRLLKSDPDSYDTAKAIWTYAAKEAAPDWSLNGPRHSPSLETLAVATLKLRDQGFTDIMREARVKVPTTGKKMAFNYWIQKEPAPLVYVVPGLGAHRQTMQALSMVEGLYDRGYSVVTFSGNFHPEFIEKASSAKVPGYAKADRRDLWAFMDAIDAWLERKHGEKLGPRGMLGSSMGGFQALSMAVDKRHHNKVKGPQIQIERFVALNPPVDLLYSMKQLDAYQKAPGQWPTSVRQERINNAVHKAVAMMAMPKGVEFKEPPFEGIESKYLVGLAFRLTLRNAIYTSQRCHKLGNLDQPLSWWHRQEAYDEILAYSFDDYLNEIILPHYAQEGVSGEQFRRESDLKRFAAGLRNTPNAHVITSSNDFLLSGADIAWLKRTFTGGRLKLLSRGGHLGGLANPKVHDLIDSKFSDLKQK